MKLPTDLIQNLNEQLNRELFAQYQYLVMASYFLEREMPGFGQFFLKQSREEGEHAMRLFHYLMEKGAPFQPLPLEIPLKNFENPLACFEKAYEYEQKVTLSYYNLLKKARDLGEYDAEEFLLWYIREQREEEALMQYWVARLSQAGDSAAALLLLDKEAGQAAKKGD